MKAGKIEEDFESILSSGVNNTGRVIELLEMRGWTHKEILPVTYKALLKGSVDPNGHKMPLSRRN